MKNLLIIPVLGVAFLFPIVSNAQWNGTTTEVKLDLSNEAKNVHIEDTGADDGIYSKLQVTSIGGNTGYQGSFQDFTAGFTSKISGTNSYYHVGLNHFSAAPYGNSKFGLLTGSYYNGTTSKLLFEFSPNRAIFYYPLEVRAKSYFSSVLIGKNCTALPEGYNLGVKGGIICENMKVKLEGGNCWADYVFDDTYKLKPLSEVEQYIFLNKHLPDVPSAAEVSENGINVAEMDAVLLQKIEELTLYMIEMKKVNEELKKQMTDLLHLQGAQK